VPCHSSPRDLFSSTFRKWLYLLARSPDFLSRSTAYKTTDIGGFFVPCHSSPRDLFSSTFWKWLYLLARSPDFLSRSTAYKTTGMGGFFICFQLLICYYDCGYPSS